MNLFQNVYYHMIEADILQAAHESKDKANGTSLLQLLEL